MYKVVIVDDEPIICEGLKVSVPWENYGCKVVGTAGNGEEGLHLVRSLKPDIIFSDICMNRMDGLTMVAAIKSEFPEMEVCLLTGYRNFDYAQNAIKLGVTRYLLKPSKMSEIKEAITCMTENLKDSKKQEEPASGSLWNAQNQKEQYLYETFIKNRPPLEENAENKIKESEANNFIVKTALCYIYDHYTIKLSLQDVAQHCYVSSWHLSKLLNRYTAKGFFEIINIIRLDQAKKLLLTTPDIIQDIAEQVGFVDVAHFSRIFKNHVGMSPSEYRHH